MRTRPHRVKFVLDPVTGLPALSAGPKAPVLTSEEVKEILESDEPPLSPNTAVSARRPRRDERIVPL